MTVSNEVKPAPFLTILIISIFFLRSLIFHSLLFFSRLLSSIKLTELYLLNTVSLQFRRYISISIMIIRKESDWIENQIKIFRQLFYLRYPEQIRLIFLSPLIYIRKNVQRLRERNTNKKKIQFKSVNKSSSSNVIHPHRFIRNVSRSSWNTW